MASGVESTQRARAQARPWYSRLGYLLLVVLGLSGGLFALYQLFAPTLPLRIERTDLNGIPVTVFAGSAAPGPAVVIAHGFAGSQQIMYPFAVTLARNGYTAVTFDFPGHGQNAAPLRGELADRELRAAQLSAALDQVTAFARARSDGRVGLLGHSMGSEAVVRYAQAHPEIAATVAVSMFYEGVTTTSPANLLLITGALEGGLRPTAEQIANQAAGGTGIAATTYGDFAAGTARRIVFAPTVEHIGVLFSPTSLAEAQAWFDAVFGRQTPAQPFIDNRTPWLGLLFASALLLFVPLTLLLQGVGEPLARSPQPRTAVAGRLWWALALVPPLVTPVVLRFVPTEGLLPIRVGGPLALHFALYGLLTGIGLLALRLRQPAAPRPAAADRRGGGLARFRRRFLIYTAMALLVVGYVFVTFGIPTHLFVLNYFPPPVRLPVAAAVFGAMLPYFLADEWLTRRLTGPRGAYAITKAAFLLSLVLAIALNPQLFFLALIAPLFVVYFAIYGLFSGLIYRRTGTPAIGALANAVIFAWSVAAVFPLVA